MWPDNTDLPEELWLCNNGLLGFSVENLANSIKVWSPHVVAADAPEEDKPADMVDVAVDVTLAVDVPKDADETVDVNVTIEEWMLHFTLLRASDAE